MYALFDSWVRSLKALIYPVKFKSLMKDSVHLFLSTGFVFIKTFFVFVIVDTLLFSFLGEKIVQSLQAKEITQKSLAAMPICSLLVTSILWFVISTGFIALLRRRDSRVSLFYIRNMLFRYVQLSFFFSCIFLFFLSLVLSLGITLLPEVPWILLVVFKTIELLSLFFWFDSAFMLKDVLISTERAINLLLYNLPLFCAFFIMLYGSNSIVMYSFFGLDGVVTLKPIMLASRFESIMSAELLKLPLFFILALKYSKFFLESLCISIVFVIYNRYRKNRYCKSFFE